MCLEGIYSAVSSEFVTGDQSSIEMLVTFVLLPIGFGVAGWATELVGPANHFILGGGLTVLVSLLFLANPIVLKFD
jgi:hypothetical protein